jgi:hypothetical protein
MGSSVNTWRIRPSVRQRKAARTFATKTRNCGVRAITAPPTGAMSPSRPR